MSIYLDDLQVLVTRPDPQGSELCQLINDHGGKGILMPTIAFESPDEAEFQQSIADLAHKNWLIFISPQSVLMSIPKIRAKWPSLPDTVKFAAVGARTAQALKDAGYNAVYPEHEWNSEALLEMPEFEDVVGQHIAIVRGGEGGREVIEHRLLARGAHVTNIIAYHRVLPTVDMTEPMHLLRQHRIDVIVCSSFTNVRHLKTLYGEAGWSLLKDIPLIVVSDRIKLLARELGFKTIWTAANPSYEAILETLAQKRNAL